jgi:glycosyltransferase involved in cell wall biosynthesis
VNIILDWFSGFLDSNNGLRINYSFYRAQLFKTLEKESFDLCIGIFSPHYHLKLCYEVKRRFNIPYVLDFRDLWDNKLMSNTYLKQGLSARLQNKFIRYHWQKWCKNALFISSSSETMAKYLSDYNDLSYPILNGYEPNLFLNEDVDLEPKFTISSIGRIYSFQDLELTFKIIKDIIGFQ